METTLQQNKGTYTLEKGFTGVSPFSRAEVVTQHTSLGLKKEHGLRPLAYFIWVYVGIFTAIMTAVILAETVFFQY